MHATAARHLLAAACLILLGLPLFSAAQPAPTDLGDKTFTPEEVVRALAPRVGEAPVRRKRGLGVVAVETGPVAAESTRRSVSMQLQFEFDSANLTSQALERLDVVGAALQSPELGKGKFMISGHTDVTGRYEYNLGLSKRRAEAVRAYLVSRHGIEVGRLITIGKASDELMDPSKPDGAVNRRVQLDAVN